MVMRGFVTTRSLVVNAITIVREFGPACYARCWMHVLRGSHRSTFLECIWGA
jgi:hypothetical protein